MNVYDENYSGNLMQQLEIDDRQIDLKVERQVKVRDVLIDIPLRYKCNAINAVFPIPTKKAKEIIRTSKIKPLELFPNKSLLCITLFDFKKAAVGPYTEMCLSIPVRYKNSFNVPFISIMLSKLFQTTDFFVFSVAQSSYMAIEHGLALTGYPRYSTTELINVDFKDDKNTIVATVLSSGEKILDLKIGKPIREKITREKYDTYFIKEKKIHKITMEAIGILGKSKVHNLTFGSHKLSQFLRELEITHHSIETIFYRDTVEIIHPPSLCEDV